MFSCQEKEVNLKGAVFVYLFLVNFVITVNAYFKCNKTNQISKKDKYTSAKYFEQSLKRFLSLLSNIFLTSNL